MVSGMVKKHLQRRKNNKGAALVMVIVSIAFIGMLVAMILYMSYANYIMKGTDKRSKDNFYSAEYALDVINAGIQTDISTEMSKAYVYVMQNSQGMQDSDMSVRFQTEFMNNMIARVQQTTDNTKWKSDYLTGKWVGNGVFDQGTAPGALVNAGTPAAYLASPSYTLHQSADYFEIRGVEITYTDANGYVSIIKTDIRVNVPDPDFAMSATKLAVENYSLIANEELLNISDVPAYKSDKDPALYPAHEGYIKGSDVTVTGSVFGGYTGITVADQKMITFKNDEEDRHNAILSGSPQTNTYLLAAKAINVKNCLNSRAGLVVDNLFRSYVEDINVQTAKLDMDGETYVADDMEISGSGSDITLHGIYKGYGNSNTGAQGSSSILINGAGTKLDFSSLNTLSLAGRAYVGATKYDPDTQRQAQASSTDSITVTEADLTTDKTNPSYSASKADQYDADSAAEVTAGTKTVYPQNKADVMMGQSIAVKADQLLYMVPDACVGYDRETGKQYVAKNPMTYDEYHTLSTAKSDTLTEKNADGTDKTDAQGNVIYQNKYDVVRLTNLWNSLDNTEYTTKDANGSDRYKAVFRRVSGTVMVYLYLDFGTNEAMANEFYKAYYDTQPEVINNYVNSYVSDVKFGSALADSGSGLSLAGNAFYMNGKNVVFQNDTTENPNKVNKIYEEADSIADQHTAAMHSLQTVYDLMLPEQENQPIFNFLVPDRTILGTLRGNDLTDGSIHAIVSDQDVIFDRTIYADADTTHLIITSGDVYLNRSIKGLVIAGGRIFIGDGCSNITYNPALVVQAMKCSWTDPATSTPIYAYEALGANGKLTYGVASAGGSNTISIRDLITYQNWKKE